MKAISGFQEVAPKAPSPNPFFLNLNAWDKDYNLTNQYQTANYSEYDAIRISTNTELVLIFAISNKRKKRRKAQG
jgi:hypothetical protein